MYMMKMRQYINFVFLCLAGATVFYLAYLFMLQLFSPNHEIVLWETESAIIVLEIITVIVVGTYCIVKAFVDVKQKGR